MSKHPDFLDFKIEFKKVTRNHASFFRARKTWVDFKDSRGQGVEDSSEMFKNYEEWATGSRAFESFA